MSYVPAVNNPHWDKVPDSLIAVSDLVLPVYPILPRPASLNFPPQPICGRMGALAYQQSDDLIYYCDGMEWLPFGSGGGFQGAQGTQGVQGSQGAQGSQGGQGAQGAQGAQGGAGAQGAQGSQGFQGSQGGTGAQGSPGIVGAAQTLFFHATIQAVALLARDLVSRNTRTVRISEMSLYKSSQPLSTVSRVINYQSSIGSLDDAGRLVPQPNTMCTFCRAPKSGVFRNLYVTMTMEPVTYTSLHEYRIVHAPSPVGDVVPTFTPVITITFAVNSPANSIYSDNNTTTSFPVSQGDLYGVEAVFNDESGDLPNYFDIGIGFDFADA